MARNLPLPAATGTQSNKVAEASKVKKTISLVDTPPVSYVAPNSPHSGGSFCPETKTWEWLLAEDTKLTVKNFKGRIYIDIRKLWNGQPTKKGISLSPEQFQQIISWNKLQDALQAVSK